MPGTYALAAQQADTCAIIGPHGERVTFGELGETVNRLSNALVSLGLKPGDAVATMQRNGPSHFEVILACTQVGLIVVPVNTHLTPAEASYIIGDCGAKAVFATDDLAAFLAPVRDSLPEHLFSVGGPGGERGAEPPFAVGGSVSGWAGYAALVASGSPAPPSARSRAGDAVHLGHVRPPQGRAAQHSPGQPGTGDQRFLPFLTRFGFRAYAGVHLVCAPLYHSAPLTFSLHLLHMGHTLVVPRSSTPPPSSRPSTNTASPAPRSSPPTGIGCSACRPR